MAFVKSLADWLANPANAGVICWNEEGTTFQINDSKRFMEELYSSRFMATRYTSFKRQLNIYGFRCRDHVFVHPFFQRGRVDYHQIMKRKGVRFEKKVKVKATEAKAVEVKATEAKAVEVKAVEVKATEAKAVEAKAVEAKAAYDPFVFDSLHLGSTAGLVDFMLGLDFEF